MKLAVLALILTLALLGARGAAADPLPPCVDGQYGVDQAGVTCQVRGDTTPTAMCTDGTYDYSRLWDACAAHGGVYLRFDVAPATATSPANGPVVPATSPVAPGPATGSDTGCGSRGGNGIRNPRTNKCE